MEYYEKLRAAREDNDYTQEEIAKFLWIGQSYYSKQERGNKPFQIEQIIKLCRLYEISADYVLGLPKGLAWPREPKEKK